MEWGVSTSAFQIESMPATPGPRPSIWDTFLPAMPNLLGPDHLHRWQEDVDLLSDLGVNCYRLSLSWARLFFEDGTADPEGFTFYDRLIDALLAAGVEPVVNLYHWDLPQSLQNKGGWGIRDTAHAFADYAEKAANALSDRVSRWVTMNEPFEHFGLGHVLGHHAPGSTLSGNDAFAVAHHLLLAHGMGTQALRAGGAKQVGLINSYSPIRAASSEPADESAAAAMDAAQNRLFTDPILLGEFPSGLEAFGMDAHTDDVRADLPVISTPLDFLGVNYYTVFTVGAPEPGEQLPFLFVEQLEYPHTVSGWQVAPEGMTEILRTLHDRYGKALPPLYVTETGAAYDETPDANGYCEDTVRIEFLQAHIAAIDEAVSAGVDVRGVMLWSLMDNLEWIAGFAQRFGLVYVDHETAKRTPKASYYWYRDLIRTRGE